MGLFSDFREKLNDTKVRQAIDVLNSGPSEFMAAGAVTTLAKHPDANPFAVRALRKVAMEYPVASIREQAMDSLREIARTHKDIYVRERVQGILDEFSESNY